MIKIAGSVQREFIFPADPPTAYAFYADMGRTVGLLTHISLLKKYSDTQYRLLYNTLELGIYRVRMVCDVEVDLDKWGHVLIIHPIKGMPTTKNEAGFYHLTGQGYYSSRSVFHQQGQYTKVEYSLQLDANLPVPLGARFIPNIVLKNIANSITYRRIDEIAEGFIERSVRAYLSTKIVV